MTTRPPRIDPSDVPMYAGVSDEDREEAIENVKRYLRVVLDIADLIERDPRARARYEALTGKRWSRRMKSSEGSPR